MNGTMAKRQLTLFDTAQRIRVVRCETSDSVGEKWHYHSADHSSESEIDTEENVHENCHETASSSGRFHENVSPVQIPDSPVSLDQ